MQAAQQKLIQTQQQQIQELNDNFKKLHATLENGKLPDVVVQNPNMNSSSFAGDLKPCQAVTVLRSGKEVSKPDPPAQAEENQEEENQEEVEHEPVQEEEVSKEQEKVKEGKSNNSARYEVPAPFPQRLLPPSKERYQSEIREIFKQVKINIPLLDAINQVPAYAKFLKELCTVKRKLNVKKKAFLTEQVSSIVNTPNKLKDPGSPIIPVTIGTKRIGNALLDLGSSVNILPYTMYLKLGLGELKETSVILQLVDRSITKPRGCIEDVLVQVDTFYYPVDFIVLDINGPQTSSSTPIILGRPFLATSNAIINCRSGQLRIEFGNMTLDLNIFDACKLPTGIENHEEVCCIDTLVEETFCSEFEDVSHFVDFERQSK